MVGKRLVPGTLAKRRRRRLRKKGTRPPGTYASLLDFGGVTYDAELDQFRLGTQLNNVWQYFKDGRWHYPEELEENVPTGRFNEKGEEQHYRWSSINARLRDFRKRWAGSHDVQSKRIAAGGSWKYRLVRGKQDD